MSADDHGALGCAADHRWTRTVQEIADGREVACTQDGDTVT